MNLASSAGPSRGRPSRPAPPTSCRSRCRKAQQGDAGEAGVITPGQVSSAKAAAICAVADPGSSGGATKPRSKASDGADGEGQPGPQRPGPAAAPAAIRIEDRVGGRRTIVGHHRRTGPTRTRRTSPGRRHQPGRRRPAVRSLGWLGDRRQGAPHRPRPGPRLPARPGRVGVAGRRPGGGRQRPADRDRGVRGAAGRAEGARQAGGRAQGEERAALLERTKELADLVKKAEAARARDRRCLRRDVPRGRQPGRSPTSRWVARTTTWCWRRTARRGTSPPRASRREDHLELGSCSARSTWSGGPRCPAPGSTT